MPRRWIPIRVATSHLDVDLGEGEFLNRLGRYLHTTRQGLAIVKLKELPSLGAKVADEKGRLVGQVADVFGPISSPYCSIRLSLGGASALESGGSELYLAERKQVSRGRKHGRN